MPDVYTALLTFPHAKPLNVANLEDARIFPSVWQDRLSRYRNGDVVMPYKLSRFPAPYDVRAAEDADVVVITRNGPLDTIKPWYPQLRPSEEIAIAWVEFKPISQTALGFRFGTATASGSCSRPRQIGSTSDSPTRTVCSSLLTRPTYSGSLLPGSTPYKPKSGGHRPAVVRYISMNPAQIVFRTQSKHLLTSSCWRSCGALSSAGASLAWEPATSQGRPLRPSAIRRGFIRPLKKR